MFKRDKIKFIFCFSWDYEWFRFVWQRNSGVYVAHLR